MSLIITTLGEVEESTLIKTEGSHENDNEIVSWQEWHFEGVLVKRDVQMHLKQGLASLVEATL